MSDLIFYTNPMSRGRIVHWMLEELGQPYETVWLEYGTGTGGTKGPEYLAVNPMGKVPALKHDNVVVTEAAAICAYLADRFPKAGLIPPPNDPARAAYFRWLFFAAGPLEVAVTAKGFGWEVPEGKAGVAGFGSLAATLDVLESALWPGPYLCGKQFTAADVYVGAQLMWAMMFGTIEKRPLFEAYVGSLYARPAALRADRINEEFTKNSASS